MGDDVFFSVIIPTYNEANNIDSCLKSLINLHYESDMYEIIVVDNGSSDNTANICKKYTNKVYVVPNVNISALRNYGASLAKGNVFAFIDADCEADPKWLSNAKKTIIRDRCITGSRYYVPLNNDWIERVWYGNNISCRKHAEYINSGNIFVPSDIFKSLGGFNEKLITGEDYEFCMRAKTLIPVIEDPDIKVYHHGNPKNVHQFIKREMWHGLGALGSINIKLFDKPLIATIFFIVVFTSQALSLLYIILKYNTIPFIVVSSLMIIFIFAVSILSRKHKWGVLDIVKLMVLYYIYLFARSISLFLLLFNIKLSRHR